MTTPAELDDRYGRTARRTTRIWLIAAGIVGVLIAALLGWNTVHQSRGSASFDDLGFEVVDSGHVEVTYRVTLRSGQGAVCTLEALDVSFAKVGWEIVEIPASETLSRDLTTTIRTVDTATTGHVVSCFVR